MIGQLVSALARGRAQSLGGHALLESPVRLSMLTQPLSDPWCSSSSMLHISASEPASCRAPQSLMASSGYATSAGADGKKKKRRSDTKLFSCRNDKLRGMFEQIWPTLQLTDEELQLFGRSSKVFITDLGRSIPLKTKFHLAKPELGSKVHHQDARSLIYESDLHLDAVGEHPRYLKVRRLRAGNYATQLQSVRKLRLLLGFSRRYVLQQLYELSKLQPGPDRVWKLISAMEATLNTTSLRMGLAHDALVARNFAWQGMIYVNGVKPLQPRVMMVQPGDVVSVGGWAAEWHKRYLTSQLGHSLMQEWEKTWTQIEQHRDASQSNTRTRSAPALTGPRQT